MASGHDAVPAVGQPPAPVPAGEREGAFGPGRSAKGNGHNNGVLLCLTVACTGQPRQKGALFILTRPAIPTVLRQPFTGLPCNFLSCLRALGFAHGWETATR